MENSIELNNSIKSIDFMDWSNIESKTLLDHGMDDFLLPSEYVMQQVHPVLLVNTDDRGTLFVTNFRLLFVSNPPTKLIALGTIPIAMIEKFSKQETKVKDNTVPRLLRVVGKDMRILVYGFLAKTKQRKLIMEELTKSLRELRLPDLYASTCEPSMLKNSNPNMRLFQEYSRLLSKANLINKWWRISEINSEYNVCPSYPSSFIVPASISDEEVMQAAKFRARGRLPVITWCHPENGAVLARSSQPSVGLMQSRSTADEKLVAALCASRKPRAGRYTKLLYIADARPRKNAIANSTMGGGSESSSNYSHARVVFLGIDNIHAVSDSFSRLRDYLDKHGATSSDGLSLFDRKGGWNWEGGNLSVPSHGDSGWEMHIHSILVASAWIAERIALQDASVLVHCSDGWDRTSQVVSLVGLLLDPYYRTFEGFQALVEKDWLAFGHPFADRLGISTLNSNKPSSMFSVAVATANGAAISSPIFLQWVDCVAQILRMYPRAFEFSSAYLVELVDCVISGLFGNFQCNNEKERKLAGIADSCGCMWVYLAKLRRPSGKSKVHEHCNIFYSPDKHPGPLLPPAAALAPTLWSCFHLRWASPFEAQCGSEIEEQLFMELQKAKEIAEEKTKDMATNVESLTKQLVSEKTIRRSAVAVAKRACQDYTALKRAMESTGCEVNFPESEDSIYTDITSSEDVEKKIMHISQKELSETKDAHEAKE